MIEYKVLADEIIGLKGAKYKKGAKVFSNYFPPGHDSYLLEKKFISKVEAKVSKESKSK